MKEVEESEFYTVKEFAKVLRRHVNTIYQMIRCGKIHFIKAGTGARASYLIRKNEPLRMMEFDAQVHFDKMVAEAIKKAKN